MKTEIDTKWIATVSATLIATKDAKSAIKYLSDKLVVKATWHNKPKANNRGETMVVTFGKPNYLERKFIADCKKAKVAFPVSKIQLKFYPVKKG
ncbi:MAG TPA: hypothetical protein VIH30_10205 [Aquirhabdus sp.]